MTGWGQDGPYAQAAGRDINYVALSGTLAMIGRAGEPPVPPLNLRRRLRRRRHAAGVRRSCAASLEAARSGRGQVVDAAMVDGAALLAGMMHGLRADGQWGERGTNLLDTGAWFYEVYETADGRLRLARGRSTPAPVPSCCGAPGWPTTSTAGVRSPTRTTGRRGRR